MNSRIATFGRYENLELLGEGGMAKVYKAHDPKLGRTVALKLIRWDDPELARRLMIEARAQARIEHEHVCKVYEVGEVEHAGFGGIQPYIAMQYIKGKTMKDLIGELDVEQKVKLMRQVAEAVHAAHQVDLIHRDLKPSNVIVERSEDGEWIPYVMDFGLAREMAKGGATMTGAVVGSPLYMSPEQAMGEIHKLDRRSDVYSLGVTLYEMLAGQLPFDSDTTIDVFVDALIKHTQNEPVPLKQRNPGIPGDLEAIVMKCLEKEPERRYDSAKALAEDLGRYLAGEAIQARPAGTMYKLYRRARRQKAIAATAGLALILVFIFAFIGLRAHFTAQKQAALAHVFGQEVRDVETILRHAYLVPLHDVRPEKDMVRQRMKRIEEQMKQVGDAGFGPGHYALGRGYLALNEYKKAKEYLELAWSRNYREPEVAYALGLTLGALYREALEEAERIRNKDLRESKKQAIGKKLRDPALEYLRKVKGATVESPEYVEASIAYYEEHWDRASKKSREAIKKFPWLFEAMKLEGDICAAKGREKENRGEYEAAMEDFKNAEDAYTAAVLVGRSFAYGYGGLCSLGPSMIDLEKARGVSPKESYEKAVTFCKQALVADPGYAYAYREEARAHVVWSEHLLYHGENPIPALEKAIGRARATIQLEPDDDTAYGTIGYAYLNQADFELTNGVDPRESLKRAEESYREAIRLAPSFGYYTNLGLVYGYIGKYEMSRGLDPRKSHEKASWSFKQALQRYSKSSAAHNNLGGTYHYNARYEMEHGLDPREMLKNAVDHYQNALRINPNLATAFGNIGLAHLNTAEYLMLLGMDTGDSLMKAKENLRRATQIDVDEFEPYVYLSRVWALEARLGMAVGKQDGELEEARTAIDKALQLNSNFSEAYVVKGYLEVVAARVRNNRSPEKQFLAARTAFGKAIELNPENWEAYLGLAELCQRQGEMRLGSAEAVIKEGLTAIEKGLAIYPSSAKSYAVKGVLLLLRARSTSNPGLRVEQSDQAQQSILAAFRINSNLQGEYQPYLLEARRLAETP